MIPAPFCLASLFLVTACSAAPTLPVASSTIQSNATQNATQTSSTADATATVPFISTDLNEVLWNSSDAQPDPQAIRGSLGATILGPTDDFITVENADLLAPPTTDNGFT